MHFLLLMETKFCNCYMQAMLDTDTEVSVDAIEAIKALDNIIRVRVIK